MYMHMLDVPRSMNMKMQMWMKKNHELTDVDEVVEMEVNTAVGA